MKKNTGFKVKDEFHNEGKISENRIFIVMAALIVIILALNWFAYNSVDTHLPSQEIASESQQAAHSSELNPNDF